MNPEWKLEPEEQELLDSYERDEWRPVDKFQERLTQYHAYAIAALEGVGVVSIALSQEDLKVIREKAAAAGMSYKTFIANIVHQYVIGNLVEKPRSA